MRIGCVDVDANDRHVVRHQAVLGESLHDELLYPVFVECLSGDVAWRILSKTSAQDSVDPASSLKVHFQLRQCPPSLEDLNELRRTHDLDSKATDRFNGTRVDIGDVRNGAARGVLHRHFAASPNIVAQLRLLFLPASIEHFFAG